MSDIKLKHLIFVGNPDQIVFGGEVHFKVCRNVSACIEGIRTQHFDGVFIEYAAFAESKISFTSFLQATGGSQVTFVVRMYEEPDIISLISKCSSSKIDYLVCPVSMQELSSNYSKPGTLKLFEQKEDRIRELELLVMQDDLTGLKNRRYLRYFLPAITEQARQLDFQVTLLLFDIDNFKHYNDTYGHSIGDQVLRQTASLLRRCCRTQDVVARLGGDEFAVVFWDRTCCSRNECKSVSEIDRRTCLNHPREAFFMAERFRHEMSASSFDLLGIKGKGSLTISGGLASFPTDADTAESLFEKADQAMFEAKRCGKNRLYLVGSPPVSK